MIIWRRSIIVVCIALACQALSVVSGMPFGRALAQNVPKPVLVNPLKMSDLPGRWIGIGRIVFNNGDRDEMKCRITYRAMANALLVQNIRCKSAERRIEIKSKMIHRDGAISGAWKDRIYELSGSIKGRLHGNQIQAALSSLFFNAAINIMLIGPQQTIEVTPHNSHMRSMQILLARG